MPPETGAPEKGEPEQGDDGVAEDPAVSEEIEQRWTRWIDGLRTCDSVIVCDFYDQFHSPLERIAAQRLGGAIRRRLDPEDVVQSAFRTFLRRANEGQFELSSSEDLWRLLCAITLTKVREQARFHLRQKRGVQRERSLDARTDTGSLLLNPADPGLTPAESSEFLDHCAAVLDALTDEEQQLVKLKLLDHTQQEIAAELGCSERSVRRLLKKVQERWQAQL